jgi:hypothetical protein
MPLKASTPDPNPDPELDPKLTSKPDLNREKII